MCIRYAGQVLRWEFEEFKSLRKRGLFLLDKLLRDKDNVKKACFIIFEINFKFFLENLLNQILSFLQFSHSINFQLTFWIFFSYAVKKMIICKIDSDVVGLEVTFFSL